MIQKLQQLIWALSRIALNFMVADKEVRGYLPREDSTDE